MAFVLSLSAALALVAYLVLLAVLELVLPGKRSSQLCLVDGTRLHYKFNSVSSMLVLLVLLGLTFSPSVLADKGWELLTTALIVCILMSLVLCVAGYVSRSQTASLRRHVTGHFLHDWWFGVQRNPQLFGLDLKFFCVRAGTMSWLLINLSIASKQFQQTGSLSLAMALYQFFRMVYVLDYLWHEEAVTATWGTIAENFGFMLIFRHMVWIPFTVSIQGWWLLYHDVEVTTAGAVFNVLVFITGYTLFRGAKKQKFEFKLDPEAPIWRKPPVVIGGKLASGYWGIARHSNYLGDLLLALSFSLPCGTSSVIPYFYPIYLFILLIWRERRKEARGRAKYKATWEEYCKAVPWRIFPGIY